MSEIMKKLLEQKSKGPMLPDDERDAKMSVLNELKSHMDGMMADKAGSLKKVSVMADSKGDLEKGLDKAKELIGQEPSELHEAREELPTDVDDSSEMSEDEIDAKIAELMALKEQKHA